MRSAGKWASLSTVGRYELLHEIARGGMAVLYLAREPGIEGFEKLVVIKRMLPELASRDDMLAMFLDEARIAALLQHPNLPHVYELVHEDGEYFFAMEYLHGADVRGVVKAAAARGGLPLEHAISIALGLCAGLHHAHERRTSDGTPLHLVHRDVSPRNVFVTYDGGVKLLDFGIAQATHKRSKTQTGTLKGTIQYMSPEQVHGGRVDRRSDVFSTSILLWELTVGRTLFGGQSDYAVMNAIVEQDAPAPSTVRADYPPALEAIVMRGLRRAPGERFQTAEELQLALEQLAREQQLATSPVGLARFMRELFRDEVDAYRLACEQGTLTARTLEYVSSASREPELAVEIPVSTEAISTEPPRKTRPLGSGGATRRAHRSWAVALTAALLGSLIVWWQWPAAAPPSSIQAPAPQPPPTPSPQPAPAAMASPVTAPQQPSTALPSSTASPPHRATSTKLRAHTKHQVRTPDATAGSSGSKPLTDDDLDAAFPPK